MKIIELKTNNLLKGHDFTFGSVQGPQLLTFDGLF